MQLRLLTKEDAEAFRTIRLNALKESPTAFSADYDENARRSLSEFAARIHCSPDNFMVGAFTEEMLVGIGGFYRSEGAKLRHKGNIWSMYVAPNARRGGIGRAIMDEILRRARLLGDIEQIHISVVASNTNARELYLSNGFEIFGREPRALKIDGTYYDEEHMALRLHRSA